MKRRSLSKSLSRISPIPIMGNGGVFSFIFIIASLGTLVFSAVNPQGIGVVRTGVTDLFAPAIGAINRPIQSAASFVRDVSGLSELQAANLRLEEENARLREWYQTALLLEAENKSLRDLLNVKLDVENRYITARILADGDSTFVKSLLVDAGLNDGVDKGYAIISGEGLVGRTIESGKEVARVLLLTDMNSRVPVLIEDSRLHAILAGSNEMLPMLMHLPPDSEIKDGARIITSGYGGIFPPGLPVGRVEKDKNGTYRVHLFADFDRMTYVRAVKRPEDPNLHTGELD